jgi:hypothetical protein
MALTLKVSQLLHISILSLKCLPIPIHHLLVPLLLLLL